MGISNGQDIFLMHLDPLNGATQKQVENYISKRMDLKDPNLQAIIIGGKDTPVSQDLSQMLTNMINKLGIPLTEMRISKGSGCLDIAYSSVQDEWIISGQKIDKLINNGMKNGLEIFNNIFNKVKIADCDEVLNR